MHGNSRNPAAWIGNWPSPFRFRGALEAEDLQILAASQGVRATRQEIGLASLPPLSGGRLLFVPLQQQGDFIDLALPESIQPGRYVLTLRLATSWNYAIVRASLNGQRLAEAVDTYSREVDATTVVAGPVEVVPGKNVLRLEAIQRNPRSTGFHAGLDALWLAPAE